MSSPKRSNFLAGTMLRFQLSWTRWRLRAAKRRLRRVISLEALQRDLAAVLAELENPQPAMRVEDLPPPRGVFRDPPPVDLVTPEMLPLVERELQRLTPGQPEPLEEMEPEQLPPEVEIAQRLGLPVQRT